MIQRLTRDAMPTSVALIIFIVELSIPSPLPIPGVKLGLANIITVYAMFHLGASDTLLILISRILLGSMFSGQMMSFFYSIAGGLCCYLVMLLLVRMLSERQMWVCSVIGAMFHNIGQIMAAVFITKTTAVLVYLPLLMISSILAGLFTGLSTQFFCEKMKRIRQHPKQV